MWLNLYLSEKGREIFLLYGTQSLHLLAMLLCVKLKILQVVLILPLLAHILCDIQLQHHEFLPLVLLNYQNHLVVVLGLERASWGYLILMISAFTSLYALFFYEIVTEGALLGLLAAPFALYLSYYVMNNYDRRELALSRRKR